MVGMVFEGTFSRRTSQKMHRLLDDRGDYAGMYVMPQHRIMQRNMPLSLMVWDISTNVSYFISYEI